MKTEYHMRLNASVEVCRYLLENALPFRENDESENSMYKGLFLGTLKLIGRTNSDIEKVILQNAPKNNQLTSPMIQKDLVTCFAEEVLKSIMGEIGDDVFALLVDESSDVSRKEQMVVVLRFVDKCGIVQEIFIGVVHVMDTSALSLKSALDALFAKHGLSFTKVRGQGYDGASNMSGKFNGLKALILNDNESAFYIHCFAHQLQLVVVAVAKKHDGVKDFFYLLALVVTVVNSSCKRKDMLREVHKDRIQEEIGNDEIETGKGLNQEISLVRAGDTRWNSHLKTITSLISLFPEVKKVLAYVEDDGDNEATRLQASGLLSYFKTFEFVFYMHLNSSCKRKDMLREVHKDRIQEEIGNDEIETGKGLNQEISLVRAGDTRWNSHLKTITSLISLFPEVKKVLPYVEDDGDNEATRLQASGLLSYFKTFEFVFYMHLILTILGLTNSLSQALQRKDQDILEAVDLIGTTKAQLQMLKENGFDQVLEKCYSFCDKHEIVKLDMAEGYVNTRNPRKRMNISNRHHYNYDIFNTVLDMQIREFGDRFCEVSTDLLQNMAALNPRNSFSQFNKSSLLKLSQMYLRDFDDKERIILEHELDIYYHFVYNDVRFANLNSIADLARLMVATRKHLSHPLVYRLLKLTLVLPVATATVERCFSAMKLVKTDLRNRIGDDFLNAALICDIEKEAHAKVKTEDVIDRFQKMKTRRGQI